MTDDLFHRESRTARHARIGPRDKWAAKSASSLYAFLIIGIIGALIFGTIAHRFAPTWVGEASFVGFIIAVVLLGFWKSRRVPSSKDEYAQGNSRTDEEVRQALADIKARKK